ncbi:MAG: hypothetical protein KAT41_07610 [Candidatus Marinimicrobia bacterium]|nr:hypothetical protein [Candidatus Neomarinimicrobiota bacterium]
MPQLRGYIRSNIKALAIGIRLLTEKWFWGVGALINPDGIGTTETLPPNINHFSDLSEVYIPITEALPEIKIIACSNDLH